MREAWRGSGVVGGELGAGVGGPAGVHVPRGAARPDAQTQKPQYCRAPRRPEPRTGESEHGLEGNPLCTVSAGSCVCFSFPVSRVDQSRGDQVSQGDVRASAICPLNAPGVSPRASWGARL